MSFATAKEFLDLLLSGERGFSDYISPENSPGIILEFIGGEPLLEVGLIDQAVDYFKQELAERMHPWATKYCISICSNGVAYFEPEVQRFLQKNREHLSLSITLDGNKELHDSCRVFPDGVTGSYEIAAAAAKDWMSRGNYMGSKITIAPENLDYLYDAVMHMVEFGYQDINANCVYEKGWELKHATKFYWQLKKIADALLESGRAREISCSLFTETFFCPKQEDDLETWCGGTGLMLSCDPDGYLYPCIRYMESSLGTEQKPFRIGDLKHGLGQRNCDKNCIACLQAVNRRTQSTDQCFYCPIAEGCSYCSAYNYQVYGTPDSRATFICQMHQARALANVYYWNRYYEIYGQKQTFPMHCPKEWALKIVPEQEYKFLQNLSAGTEQPQDLEMMKQEAIRKEK